MDQEIVLLAIAVVCATIYAVVFTLLLWRNSDSRQAWCIGVVAFVLWPSLFFAGPLQLVFAIPVAAVMAIDGVRLRPTISTKASSVAVGVTAVYAAIVIGFCFAISS